MRLVDNLGHLARRDIGWELDVLKQRAALNTQELNGVFRSMFHASLADFAGRHAGGRCFVIGNGPSLKQIDMSLLKNEITLGSNRVFLGFDDWGYNVNYWMVQDEILVSQNADQMSEELPDDIVKFVPFSLLKYFDVSKMQNLVPVNLDYSKRCTFSDSPDELHEGYTVTVGLLQIAAVMGFKQIVLIGVDHNYNIPASHVNSDGKWTGEGLGNHFSDDYARSNAGQVWEVPYIDLMTKSYGAAATWAREHGVDVVNATPDTNLQTFQKVPFESLF